MKYDLQITFEFFRDIHVTSICKNCDVGEISLSRCLCIWIFKCHCCMLNTCLAALAVTSESMRVCSSGIKREMDVKIWLQLHVGHEWLLDGRAL